MADLVCITFACVTIVFVLEQGLTVDSADPKSMTARSDENLYSFQISPCYGDLIGTLEMQSSHAVRELMRPLGGKRRSMTRCVGSFVLVLQASVKPARSFSPEIQQLSLSTKLTLNEFAHPGRML